MRASQAGERGDCIRVVGAREHNLQDLSLLALLDGIVDRGNTVVVVEHHLAVVQHADWIIDLGPDGGKNGGEVVFTGTPEKLVAAEGSLTGEYLRRHLSG